MTSFIDNLRAAFHGEIRTAEPLSRHTTWRVGGPADLFLTPVDRDDLLLALRTLAAGGVPWFPLGAGSNLLVRDGGFRGAAVYLGLLRRLEFGLDGEVAAGGGLPLMSLVRATAGRGLSGVEGLAGVSGTVGGAVVMNAGAGGQELAAVVKTAILAGPEGEEIWDVDRLAFGYRRSAVPDGRIVVEATLRFTPASVNDLQEAIARHLAHRRAAHPVGLPHAGSVFKNPPGQAAWRLIEAAGMRGAKVGGAQISPPHANFIVNAGGATAADILTLIDRIREAVLKQSGIELVPEVRIVGED